MFAVQVEQFLGAVTEKIFDKNKTEEGISPLSLLLLLSPGMLIIGWGILDESHPLINAGIVILLLFFLYVIFKRDVVLPAVKPERPYWQRKFLLIFILIIATTLTTGLLKFKAYRTDEEYLKQNGEVNIRLLMDRPSIVSPRDAYSVSLIMKNEGTENISGTVRLLILPENVICSTEDGNLLSKIAIENLSPKDSIAEKFNCTSLSAPINNYMNIKVSFTADQTLNVIESPEHQVRVIKIPYFQTALYWLLSGVLTATAGMFWEQIKRKYFESS